MGTYLLRRFCRTGCKSSMPVSSSLSLFFVVVVVVVHDVVDDDVVVVQMKIIAPTLICLGNSVIMLSIKFLLQIGQTVSLTGTSIALVLRKIFRAVTEWPLEPVN